MELKVMILRLLISILVGGAIGLEREIEHKPAGLRTIILVCLGSTIFMILGLHFLDLGFDLDRIVAGVITGIGFLGAGAIIRARGEVHGLTTAATIWLVSGLGLVIGAGYYLLAIIASIFILIVLRLLGVIEKALAKK
ncbi:MgtC/SapB family protein [candidate division WOR-3 bacterium]|uniref:MgtC/SapB family protein n=1 Tax=candidate division WOR-3 bacterium TaxID=2052148 RepID=A0A660SN67_UNCW3|nr:MAG: MgtC/SapB family protein [candidate division WOR-3 bacterium]